MVGFERIQGAREKPRGPKGIVDDGGDDGKRESVCGGGVSAGCPPYGDRDAPKMCLASVPIHLKSVCSPICSVEEFPFT